MNGKVKVAHIVDLIRPGGGPKGYLYNLHRALEDFGSSMSGSVVPTVRTLKTFDHRVYSISLTNSRSRKFPDWLRGSLLKLPSSSVDLFVQRHRSRGWNDRLNDFEPFLRAVHNESEALVFHSPLLLSLYRKMYPEKKRIVALMQHTPTPFTFEDLEGLLSELSLSGHYDEFPRTKSWYLSIERGNFEYVDVVLVPCGQALEGYSQLWPEFRGVMSSKRIYELPSGIPLPEISQERDRILAELRFQDSDLVVGFFGRHHYHKGYDVFLEMADFVKVNSSDRIQFLTAGTGNIQTSVSQVVDLGWQEKVFDYMNACDIIVLPNRYAYFDLVALEAIALGKVVIASHIGGNKYLSEQLPGFFTADSPADYCELLEDFAHDKGRLEKLGMQNQQAYWEKYSLEPFLKRHCVFAEWLLRSLSLAE